MSRSNILKLGAALALVSAAFAGPALAASGAKSPRTLGYVVTQWDYATYESPFADECPEGLAVGNDEYWWRGLSRADKDKLTNTGLIQPIDRRGTAVLRGPQGEDVCWKPEIVKDPPMRTVKGKLAFGFNLDGTTDGKATPKSCAHEKFTGVDNTPGVDNQVYRLLGCLYGWRRNGVMDAYDDEERRNSGRGVILMEITNVDDARNDDAVDITFYRAIDPFSLDATGKILPYGSYRIDMANGKPRYGATAKGKIVNGVLTTTPIDLSLPYYANSIFAEMRLRDMQFRLELPQGEGKAKGLMGGYYDFDKWWEYMMKAEFLVATGDWSCPAMWEAAHRLADGYPDKDGKCTALSTAFKVEALPAFIVHQDRTAAAR